MNPARELHAILTRWKDVPQGQSVYNVRTGALESDPDGTEHYDLIRAGWLLGEVKREIDLLEARGEEVEYLRVFLPQWYDALYLPSHQWMSVISSGAQVVTPATLATLASFAALLDTTRIRPYPTDQIAMDVSKAAAEDIFSVLRERDDLPDETRGYVFGLLDEIRTLLDANDLRVTTDLVRRINELRGWLATYVDHLEATNDTTVASKLKRAAMSLVPKARSTFLATGFALGVAADTLAITQGLSG